MPPLPEKALKLSAILAQRVGLGNISSRTRWGAMLKATGVQRTREWDRIDTLPRRRWQDDLTLPELRNYLHQELRRPGGEKPCGPDCRCPRELWDNQVAALQTIFDVRGGFFPQGVGKGKALISLLIPTILDGLTQRPVLIVPARLRAQTEQQVLPMLRQHWRIRNDIEIVAYSELSIARGADLWEKLKPDLIIADEGHRLKNKDAARTRRFSRYMKENPYTMFVVMSGTISKRSLRDYAHLLRWALKADLTPLPDEWRELTTWARAIDGDVPADQREKPGVLLRWGREGESVAEIYGRRLTETPGVVATEGNEVASSLRIYRALPPTPTKISEMIDEMRRAWETPNGDIITEAVELWRHARELSLGFWSRWNPPAPQDWMTARKAWGKYVRETLQDNRRGLDSPLQVWNEQEKIQRYSLDALDREAAVDPAWLDWRSVKDTFKPNAVPEWVDDYMLKFCMEWLIEHKGICWIEHVPFGRRLVEYARECGHVIPYYGAGSKDDEALMTAEGGPIIASLGAHGEGKNLQDRWSANLIPAPMASGQVWEQLIGRTHRTGQLADEVEVHACLHLEELHASFRRARSDARNLEATLRSRQKLLYADYDFDPGP